MLILGCFGFLRRICRNWLLTFRSMNALGFSAFSRQKAAVVEGPSAANMAASGLLPVHGIHNSCARVDADQSAR